MALPKLNSPYFSITLHNNKKVKIRPFTVREEKLLLMAAQDKDDTKFIVDTIFQILDNCVVAEDYDIRKLPTFDIEYLFIQIRSKSVGNKITKTIKDGDGTYSIDIDLEEVKIVNSPDHTNKIVLNDEYVLTMKYPTFEEVSSSQDDEDGISIIMKSMDKLINLETNEVEDFKDYSEKEVKEFIESFSMQNMKDIQSFFATLPKVSLSIDYINNKNETVTKEFTGLVNFF